MSEVPYMDTLGPDLAAISEEELLRYFLNEDFEHPFDSKVPNNSPLDSPVLPSLPATSLDKPPQVSPISTVVVKKEGKANSTVESISNSTAALQIPSIHPQNTLLSHTPVRVTSTLTSIPPIHASNNKFPNAKNTPISTTKVKSTSPTTPCKVPPPSTPSSATSSSPSPSPPQPPSPSPSLPSPSNTDDDKSAKRQRRLLKNRESAQLSRIRKRMYIEELERKLSALTSENNGLRDEVQQLNNIIKQVTEKGLSVKNDLVQSSVGIMRSMQARKYAGMCLLIILFSLGLFLNAAPQGARFGADVSSDSSRIVELNNETPFRGFKTTNPENAATAPRLSSEKKEKSEKKEDKPYDEESLSPDGENSKKEKKRSFPDGDTVVPSKRAKIDPDCDIEIHVNDDSSTKPGIEEVDEELFNVLEDDAFVDGVMQSPSSSSSSSTPSSPSFSVPSTPILPLSPASPSIPETTITTTTNVIPFHGRTNSVGVALLVPSFPFSASSGFSGENAALVDGFSVLNVHVWPVVNTIL